MIPKLPFRLQLPPPFRLSRSVKLRVKKKIISAALPCPCHQVARKTPLLYTPLLLRTPIVKAIVKCRSGSSLETCALNHSLIRVVHTYKDEYTYGYKRTRRASSKVRQPAAAALLLAPTVQLHKRGWGRGRCREGGR